MDRGSASDGPIRRKTKSDCEESGATIAARPNHTGLPETLMTGIEQLSGCDMSDVRVYFNSSRPARLQALACTQGTDIHVAPGQERHLPHEAWHVVQQKQRRVQPTVQLKDAQVNDDRGLAALASHGGRFAYEAQDHEIGDAFYRRLLLGEAHEDEGKVMEGARGHILAGSGARPIHRRQQTYVAHAGLYERRSTHPQAYSETTGRWKEGKSTLGDKTGKSMGMNIAFGGIWNESGGGKKVGPEGAIFNTRKRTIKSGRQHGHAFIKYDSVTGNRHVPQQAGGRLMIGFEGSGPAYDSLVGAHGIKSAVQSNERSLTGQGKANDLGLPTAGMGGVKANVNEDSLAHWTRLVSDMKLLHEKEPETERALFKRLLASTNQAERQAIAEEASASALVAFRKRSGL